jgi:GNAT superfamily N-acetyltransferase
VSSIAATSGATGYPVTTSGAKIATIPAETAEAFLARLGERAPDPIELALGAFEDELTLIGVAAYGAVKANHGSLIVAVAPERRRLGIGSDLLQTLLADAARTGVRWFLVSYPSDAVAADALVRNCGLTTARRSVADCVTAVLDTTSSRSTSR